jgi:hypothetical protein
VSDKKLVKVLSGGDREKKGGKEQQLLVSCEGHESADTFLNLSNLMCMHSSFMLFTAILKMILTAIFIHIVMQTVNIFHY